MLYTIASVDVTIFIYYYNVKINRNIRVVIMLINKMREEAVNSSYLVLRNKI